MSIAQENAIVKSLVEKQNAVEKRMSDHPAFVEFENRQTDNDRHDGKDTKTIGKNLLHKISSVKGSFQFDKRGGRHNAFSGTTTGLTGGIRLFPGTGASLIPIHNLITLSAPVTINRHNYGLVMA
jgi:hypothetical protein